LARFEQLLQRPLQRIIGRGAVKRPDHLPTLPPAQHGRPARLPFRIRGHRLQRPHVITGQRRRLIARNLARVVVQPQTQRAGGRVQVKIRHQREVRVLEHPRLGNLHVLLPRQRLVHVEVVEVERRLVKRLAGLRALEPAGRVPAVRQALPLRRKRPLQKLSPRAPLKTQTEGNRVQKQAQNTLPVLLFRPAVGYQTGEHVPATAG